MYHQQLKVLAGQIPRQSPNEGPIRFLHEHARPHVANITCQKLLELRWEELIRPHYSLDSTPSDYHLFLTLHCTLQYKTVSNKEDLNRWREDFFAFKPEPFFRDCIQNRLEKWPKVIGYVSELFD